ncbi:hypothetical protein [Ferrimonas kyonanensis]|uniref:hypothetical protein n=1 Tax=Ferrimonas kyonanensis TaxID=364763 RepID=UPI0004857ED7|nr:hypothetical protein [Ferrimonas kyonanensis]
MLNHDKTVMQGFCMLYQLDIDAWPKTMRQFEALCRKQLGIERAEQAIADLRELHCRFEVGPDSDGVVLLPGMTEIDTAEHGDIQLAFNRKYGGRIRTFKAPAAGQLVAFFHAAMKNPQVVSINI